MATPIPVVPDVQPYQELVKDTVEITTAKEPAPDVEPKIEDLELKPTEELSVLEGVPMPKIEDLPLKPTEGLSVLEGLTTVDRLLITRRLRVKGVLFLRGKKNRFFVRTPDQNLVYTVEEENSWWVGYFFYGLRPLQLRVTNREGEEIMRIFRPYAFTTRILPCQLQRLQVFAPPGTCIGSLQQVWSAVKPQYVVRNNDGEDVFWIHGPRFTLSCFRDVQFHILRPDGTQVGATCKRWEGVMHALFFAPVTDRFGVAFEVGLKVEEKALLLAATLLLDYMYYDV